MEENKQKSNLKEIRSILASIIIVAVIGYFTASYFQIQISAKKEDAASNMALEIVQQQMENDAPAAYRGYITAPRGWISDATKSIYKGSPSYYYEVSFQVSIPFLGMTIDGEYNASINISEDLSHYEILSHGYTFPTSDEVFGDFDW